MTSTIRLAQPDDARQMLAIYEPFILNNAVSFELDVPTTAEFESRITHTLTWFPWLVCESAGTVIGYSYASNHATRGAYNWSVDVSLYVAEEYRRQGVGRALYTSLFACLRLQGYFNAYAGITLPNPASVTIHETMGFTCVGALKDDGYKFGQWHSVGWWELPLQKRAVPHTPISLPSIKTTPGCLQAMDSGVPYLKLQ